jgi:hypothetical protein
MSGIIRAAAAAGLVLAVGCSSGGAPAPSGGNALVCQHYRAQNSWREHLTFPTVADTVKWVGYVAADAAEAQPGTKLARDLHNEERAMKNAIAGKPAAFYKNGTVSRDCAG